MRLPTLIDLFNFHQNVGAFFRKGIFSNRVPSFIKEIRFHGVAD
jgi:hypothetical protein